MVMVLEFMALEGALVRAIAGRWFWKQSRQ
jgi:hypothetical protein